MAHEVVRKLTRRLEYLGHCITMDNYFSYVPLFIEFA